MVDIKFFKPQLNDITITWLYDGDIRINRCLTSYGVTDGFIRERVVKSIVHEMLHHILHILFDNETSSDLDKLAVTHGDDLFSFKKVDKVTLKILDMLQEYSVNKLRNIQKEYERR